MQYFSRHSTVILFIDVKVLRRFAWIGWHRQDYQLLIQVFIYRKKNMKKNISCSVETFFTHSIDKFHRSQHLIVSKEQTRAREGRSEWMEKSPTMKIPRQETNKNNNNKAQMLHKFISWSPSHTQYFFIARHPEQPVKTKSKAQHIARAHRITKYESFRRSFFFWCHPSLEALLLVSISMGDFPWRTQPYLPHEMESLKHGFSVLARQEPTPNVKRLFYRWYII